MPAHFAAMKRAVANRRAAPPAAPLKRAVPAELDRAAAAS